MSNQQSGIEDFLPNEDTETTLHDDLDEDDTESILSRYFSNFEWDFTEVNRQNGDPVPIPANSKVVTALFETVSMEVAERMADDVNAHLIESNSRQYPDVNLRNAFENNLTALDFKSTRIKSSTKVSGMTLGSCGEYFSNPRKDTGGSKFPYGDYDEHWVVCFAYKWDENKKSENMVSSVETLVGKKWEFAAAPPSNDGDTNSTNQITSQTDLRSLRNRSPYFDSREEFEQQWKEQGND